MVRLARMSDMRMHPERGVAFTSDSFQMLLCLDNGRDASPCLLRHIVTQGNFAPTVYRIREQVLKVSHPVSNPLARIPKEL